MPTIISNGGSLAIRKPALSEFDFFLDVQEQTVIVSQGSLVDAVDGDANVKRSTESTIENRFLVAALQTAGDRESIGVLASGAGTASSGIVSRVTDGACQIYGSHAWLKRREDVVFARTGGQVSDTFDSYVAGSLAKHIRDAMVAKATGKTNANLPVYTTQSHGSSQYVRNTNCWIDVDLSCASPWNSAGATVYAGTAISPRHIIYAAHYQIPNGTTVRFVTANNQIVERTQTNSVTLSQSESLAVDITIGVLDSDLPVSVRPAKVFPADVADYLPTIGKYYIPAFAFDAEEKVVSRDWYRIEDEVTHSRNWTLNCTQSPFAALTESIVGGDSGNPVFTVVGGEAVLLGCWAGANGVVAASSAPHLKISEINAAMTTLGGGYQLTTVDLSGFNFYG